MVEALPGVTVPPSRLKAGRSLARPARVASARGPSSRDTVTGSPLGWGTSTGTTSRAKAPASQAATALRWLSTAKASWSSRDTP